jgi:hypothetical protein
LYISLVQTRMILLKLLVISGCVNMNEKENLK